MDLSKRLIRPVAWAFYVVVVFEILFMISPFALHFYAAYGPALNSLNGWPATAWLTKFYLPHFTETDSALLNAAPALGMAVIVVGLGGFLVAAIPLYASRWRGTGPVIGGLYSTIRHPQYLALAITGVGTALVWPRFFVLVTLVTMVFLYVLLADWEEERCLDRFGEDYRQYQRRTGRFLPRRLTIALPRILPASGVGRMGMLAGGYLLVVSLVVVSGFLVRDRSLARVTALYQPDTAVISTALLGREELERVYRIARSDERVGRALEKAGEGRWIVYAVPSEWLLPDLPLDRTHSPGGHHVPANFDRTRYKVLFARARLDDGSASGVDIVKAAHGRDPLIVAHVDLEEAEVTDVTAPPPHVKWGDIPTPMF